MHIPTEKNRQRIAHSTIISNGKRINLDDLWRFRLQMYTCRLYSQQKIITHSGCSDIQAHVKHVKRTKVIATQLPYIPFYFCHPIGCNKPTTKQQKSSDAQQVSAAHVSYVLLPLRVMQVKRTAHLYRALITAPLNKNKFCTVIQSNFFDLKIN